MKTIERTTATMADWERALRWVGTERVQVTGYGYIEAYLIGSDELGYIEDRLKKLDDTKKVADG